MTVQRYRRKPRQEDREDQFAARYEPGAPLDDLRAIARMAGDEAEVIEAVFPSGKRLLLVWFLRYDDHLAGPDYVTVESGNYLAYSSGRESLYASGDANWRQFYDLVPDGESGGADLSGKLTVREAAAPADIRPARLSADLTMADGRTVHVPVVEPLKEPVSGGKARILIPYPAGEAAGVVVSAAVTNADLGMTFRRDLGSGGSIRPGLYLTVEFGEESLDAGDIARVFGEWP